MVSAPDQVRVHTRSFSIPRPRPLPAWAALAGRFGPDQVYLLESASGQGGQDARHEFIGFGELLTVSVTRGAVEVRGVPALRAAVLDRTRDLLVDGRLPVMTDLWPFLRAVQGTFDAQRL